MSEKWVSIEGQKVTYSCREALADLLAVSKGVFGAAPTLPVDGNPVVSAVVAPLTEATEPQVREVTRAWLLGISPFGSKILRSLIFLGGTASSAQICADAGVQVKGIARSLRKINESWLRLWPGGDLLRLDRPSRGKMVIVMARGVAESIAEHHPKWLHDS